MKIVFMGTPDFAVPCLQALVDGGYDVVGVFAQPDKPKGRGYQLAAPPVKERALACGLPVYQPQSLKDAQAMQLLRELAPDLIVVVAYGKILPQAVLELPPLGCVNVHASLLPLYRGAGPIQWSVLNGEKQTGVTTMYMDAGVDTGDMILKRACDIGPDETAEELHDRLSEMGAALLAETVPLLAEGKAPRTPQDSAIWSYAPMLRKDMGEIEFGKRAEVVHNLVRGLAGWPTAYTFLDGKRLKVHRSRIVEGVSGTPGELLDERRMLVACGAQTALELLEVQLEGAKRMPAADFMRGRQLARGTVLGK